MNDRTERTDRTVREAITATDQALQVFEALFVEHLTYRAENQRLRDRWDALVDAPNGIYTGTQLRKIAREALAGDAE